jgi:hypothetical protein
MSSKPPLQPGTKLIAYKHKKLMVASSNKIPVLLVVVAEETKVYEIKCNYLLCRKKIIVQTSSGMATCLQSSPEISTDNSNFH